jgi:hypothetical protein
MKVGLDVDGVLANFYLEFCRLCNKPYDVIYSWDTPWIDDHFHLVLEDEGFWKRLPIISQPESINFDFDYYITSIPPGMKEAREEWLKINGFPDKPVIVSDDKVSVMQELGVGVLIDDKYETLVEVEAAGLLPIQFIPKFLYPEGEVDITIKHLSEVNGILAGFKEEYTTITKETY